MKSIKIDGVTIQRGNSKMGNVMHINLPPPMTCKGRPCLTDGCYAMKFYKIRKEVKKSWDSNWAVLQERRDLYFDAIAQAVDKVKPKMFRWHSAGDIPNFNYIMNMEDVARRNPDTRFMCFTKNYDLMSMLRAHKGLVSGNSRYIVSAWPGMELEEWVKGLYPVAWMHDEKNPDPNIPEDALPCSGGCETCGVCWALKPGQSVVFDKH